MRQASLNGLKNSSSLLRIVDRIVSIIRELVPLLTVERIGSVRARKFCCGVL